MIVKQHQGPMRLHSPGERHVANGCEAGIQGRAVRSVTAYRLECRGIGRNAHQGVYCSLSPGTFALVHWYERWPVRPVSMAVPSLASS